MMTIRRADTLGSARSDGLTLRCHFAFADYRGPACMHEGRLRAINTGMLPPGGSYHLGPEASVDILTWLGSGRVTAHADDFAPEDVRAGGLHLASTGRGYRTLEWKAGADGASFIQFWLMADTEGTPPAQETRAALAQFEDGGFTILASGFPEDDPEESESVSDGAPVTLSARARLLHAAIAAGEGAAYQTSAGRDLYLVVVSGTVSIDASILHAGDGAAITDATDLTVIAYEAAVVLLTDVAA